MKPSRQIACRKQVAALLKAVLEDEISSNDALNCWPAFCNADPSVECAYTMLWYWESDEERRQQEDLYADVQIQQLYTVIGLLEMGKPLPESLLIGYKGKLAPIEYERKNLFRHYLWQAIEYKNMFIKAAKQLLAQPSWLRR